MLIWWWQVFQVEFWFFLIFVFSFHSHKQWRRLWKKEKRRKLRQQTAKRFQILEEGIKWDYEPDMYLGALHIKGYCSQHNSGQSSWSSARGVQSMAILNEIVCMQMCISIVLFYCSIVYLAHAHAHATLCKLVKHWKNFYIFIAY